MLLVTTILMVFSMLLDNINPVMSGPLSFNLAFQMISVLPKEAPPIPFAE
jgi:hypothetical protein